MLLKSNSPEDTLRIGTALGKLLQPGDILALYGDLGAGKTLISKGIAGAQGVPHDEVTSPTFSLIQVYDGDIPVYHFDTYRLDRPDQIEDLGYEEYFYGDGITIIEWAGKVLDFLPPSYITISIEKGTGEGERTISIESVGTEAERTALNERLKVLEELF